jgi:hypothetical protein
MDCSTIRQITNNRIYERNIPPQPLQQYVSFRSVPTKYSWLPIVDPRVDPEILTPVIEYSTYNPYKEFNPGNTTSPWSGYATNVDTESVLRDQISQSERGSLPYSSGQFYAANRCTATTYVPNSNSDLYENNFAKQTSQYPLAEFPYLFKQEQWNAVNPGSGIKETMVFGNGTRLQR